MDGADLPFDGRVIGWSVRELIASSGLPRYESERLLLVATGLDRARLATVENLGSHELSTFARLAERRRNGEPLQYIEGTVQFGPLELRSDARALIPRPETEQLWEKVEAMVAGSPPRVVVDLCTGSGNLALALKHSYRDAEVYATDVSAEALELAAENAAATGLSIELRRGDLFGPLPESLRGAVDLLVANPPYLATTEFDSLPIDVRDHEPTQALIAGPNGDEVLRRIAAQAGEWLRPGGVIACEISEFRVDPVERLFRVYGATVEEDLSGKGRFVIGHAPAG